MSLKHALLLTLLLTAPLPASAGSLYPMECGDLRREAHSLSPSPLHNPLQVQWMMPSSMNIGDPCNNPTILSDRVIQSYSGGLRCYDRATGKILWTWVCNPATSLWNGPCYDADRNLLYQGCTNGDTLALDPQTGNVTWTYNHQPNGYPMQYSEPLYVNGKLYVGNGGLGFLCLDPDTRNTLWHLDFGTYFGAPFQDGIATPAYDNGSIYLSTSSGHLFSINAASGLVQWHVNQHMIHQTCPLLSDEYVYTLSYYSQVECRSRVDGSLVWDADTHSVFGNTNGNMALCGDILIVPGDSWRVWGLNRFTGAKIWCTLLTGNFALNSAYVACGKVYISACHGDYYSLDGQTGQIEWRLHHGVELTFVGWAEADGQLFVSNRSGVMLCFTSVTPGNPANCVCNLNATPAANYTPSPTPTAIQFVLANCVNPPAWTLTPTVTSTPTLTFTPTASGTPTQTPTPTSTPTSVWTPTVSSTPTVTSTASITDTPTPTATMSYANPDTAVAAALGVPVSIVDEARALGLDPTTTYVIILLTKHCGCHPHDLFVLHTTITWIDICIQYGTTWDILVSEEQALTAGLLPEYTPTFTSTLSSTLTATSTATLTNTFTATATATTSYANADTSVAAALGVPVSIVDEARALGLDPTTTYVIILLTKLCGCQPHDLYQLHLTMTWTDVCVQYGTTWEILVTEEQALTTGLIAENTPTFTTTPSSTPTVSSTPTATWTVTLTRTATLTSTATLSPTPTVTPTPSLTITWTPTFTVTSTMTPTASFTVSSTPTWTSTTTRTFTFTPTWTFTSTPSPTPTWTPTFTVTGTFTATPSPTSTAIPWTPTTTATVTPDTVCHPVAYPNPSNGCPVHFHCGGGPFNRITLKVYTTSLREICKRPQECHGTEAEDLDWDLKGDAGGMVSNGLYYVVLETQAGGLVEHHICKVLVLR